jgi:hypothetical protein
MSKCDTCKEHIRGLTDQCLFCLKSQLQEANRKFNYIDQELTHASKVCGTVLRDNKKLKDINKTLVEVIDKSLELLNYYNESHNSEAIEQIEDIISQAQEVIND